MVKKKYQSKRLTLHKKYKIAKKVREHKRVERKKERLNQHKKKKDPGIPNNWPFKEELLQQVENARLAEIAAKKEAEQQRKLERKERKRAEQIARANGGAATALAPTPLSVEMQSKKDLKDAVVKSDLVIIVLDARDPQGSRSLSLEDGLIGKAGKKVLLVLNKIDLISAETAEKWVTYLRRFHPTIPVRALNHKVLETKKKSRVLQGKKALYERSQELTDLRDNGTVDTLRHFLDVYSELCTELTHVAIVGYPNVGKSTLFNSIKKRAIATVDKMPSSTKTALEAQYNEKLVLVDCPALDVDYSAESSIVLRHGVASVWLEDPVPVVRELLERGNGMNLMQQLQIPIFKSHEDFLAKLAVKKNLLRKGGDPDILQTARGFLRDLGNGTYMTTCLPPAKSKSRFDMPKWYTKLSLSKLAELETALFLSNKYEIRREITFTAAPVAHAAGDTTEFDLVMGQLPENDGLTSDEEEDEEMEGDEDLEDEEVDDDEDDE